MEESIDIQKDVQTKKPKNAIVYIEYNKLARAETRFRK